AELLKQLGGNGRQVYRLGFRFARHTSSFGASYALNTKLLTGPSPWCRAEPTVLRDFEVVRDAEPNHAPARRTRQLLVDGNLRTGAIDP
ncbi:hypothetical protein, partial [Burkholderia aenigmatica]|uniref:hypothetical protein n=1 Tax=Burkholderia aenigmatica TaxID=2015348 RepID=UPI002659FE52